MIAAAQSGTTFVRAPGTYAVGRLNFDRAGVTLRSQGDNAAAVIIDGSYTTPEIFAISGADVTIAHVTIRRAVDHLVHISPLAGGTDVLRTVLHDVTFEDAGEQFVKANPNAARTGSSAEVRVECSRFVMTAAGRPRVERTPGGCYTGGIDAHAARGWVVARNRFEGIYCAGEGLAEHAIHFWAGGSGTLVERNVIVNCARGIGFGLGEGTGRHVGGIIRNNAIWADVPYFDTGIGIEDATGTRVLHNTVLSADNLASFFASIDLRYLATDAEVRNNLTRAIRVRDSARPTMSNNLEATPLSTVVGAAAGDFHLSAGATQAIDRGMVVPEAGLDLDGQPHTMGAPDLGADER